jgi:hypothetical protein
MTISALAGTVRSVVSRFMILARQRAPGMARLVARINNDRADTPEPSCEMAKCERALKPARTEFDVPIEASVPCSTTGRFIRSRQKSRRPKNPEDRESGAWKTRDTQRCVLLPREKDRSRLSLLHGGQASSEERCHPTRVTFEPGPRWDRLPTSEPRSSSLCSAEFSAMVCQRPVVSR